MTNHRAPFMFENRVGADPAARKPSHMQKKVCGKMVQKWQSHSITHSREDHAPTYGQHMRL